MSINPNQLYPPQPSTSIAQSVHLSYDPINDRIAYANGKSIIVRSLNSESTIPSKQFTKHVHATTVATFSPSGNYIASGDESGQVKIWDCSVINSPGNDKPLFEQPYIKSEFQILSGPIKSIAWDADNARIIAVGQGKDSFGKCFSWDSGNSVGEIQGHPSAINAVDIKPQRPYRAATVGEHKALVFFNGPPFKFDKSVKGYHTNSIRAIKFSPDGKWLVSAGADRTIVVYDGKTGEFIKKFENAHEGGIFAVSWFKDSSKFVTASADNTIKSWEIESGKVVGAYIVDSNTPENQQVGVCVTNDFIVSLSFNGNLNFFFENDATPKRVVSGHQSALTSLKLQGKSLVSGGSDGSLYKWELNDNKLSAIPSPIGNKFEKHGNYVSSLTTIGDKLISTGWDDTLKFWEKLDLVDSIPLSGQPKQVVKAEDLLLVLFETKVELYKDSSKICEEILTFSSSSISVIPSAGKFLINNLNSNTIEEYTFTSTKISKTSTRYPSMRSSPTLIVVSPDGKFAAVADSAGKYTLFNVEDVTVVTTRWAFHSSTVLDAKWTPDSKFLISGGLDSYLFLYSVERPAKVLKFPLAHQNGVTGLELLNYDLEDRKVAYFVSSGLDGVIKSWYVDLSNY